MNSGIILALLISIPTWVMLLPIGLCSVLLLAVFIERMIFYRIYSINFSTTIRSGVLLARGGSTSQAVTLFKGENSTLSHVLLNFLETKEIKEKEKILNEGTHKVATRVELFLGLVSTISTISPMFGLLGTVTGMMKSFSALASNSVEGQNLLAAGIAEALVTTATGLLVAIPAVVLYNYMVSRSSIFLKDLELAVNSLMESDK